MREHTIDESLPTDDAEPVEVTPLGGSYVTTTATSIRTFGRYTDTDFAPPRRQHDPSRRQRRRG
ncbi:hypothetical protein [Microbacterium sp. A1-JK]|uniref:hypothetical protein n=1 Tax=Microbacterium sp. A1-JK TaxID=3177516 RepID=UPI0038890030